jgi:hypothetical protein
MDLYIYFFMIFQECEFEWTVEWETDLKIHSFQTFAYQNVMCTT